MSPSRTRIARTARPWALACATLLASAAPAAAQFGYGYGPYGYGGYGYGYGYGYGGFAPAYGPVGYGGYGYGGFGYGGYGYGGFGGSFGGYPLLGQVGAANIGYGNTLGIGLVPPAYVGTGTAGLGPIGIGGINPLFGLGLSPLAVNNAAAELSLRRGVGPGPVYYRGYSGQPVRLQYGTNNTLPNSYTNQTIPNAAVITPR